MHLVQLLLPLVDNAGQAFPRERFERIAAELTQRFGGLTAYTRSPAEGHWKQPGGTHFDDVVVLEVMIETLDRDWWAALRQRLEQEFRQKEVVVRAQPIERL